MGSRHKSYIAARIPYYLSRSSDCFHLQESCAGAARVRTHHDLERSRFDHPLHVDIQHRERVGSQKEVRWSCSARRSTTRCRRRLSRKPASESPLFFKAKPFTGSWPQFSQLLEGLFGFGIVQMPCVSPAHQLVNSFLQRHLRQDGDALIDGQVRVAIAEVLAHSEDG